MIETGRPERTTILNPNRVMARLRLAAVVAAAVPLLGASAVSAGGDMSPTLEVDPSTTLESVQTFGARYAGCVGDEVISFSLSGQQFATDQCDDGIARGVGRAPIGPGRFPVDATSTTAGTLTVEIEVLAEVDGPDPGPGPGAGQDQLVVSPNPVAPYGEFQAVYVGCDPNQPLVAFNINGSEFDGERCGDNYESVGMGLAPSAPGTYTLTGYYPYRDGFVVTATLVVSAGDDAEPGPVAEPDDGLADTGPTDATSLGTVAAVMLTGGLALIGLSRWRRRNGSATG